MLICIKTEPDAEMLKLAHSTVAKISRNQTPVGVGHALALAVLAIACADVDVSGGGRRNGGMTTETR